MKRPKGQVVLPRFASSPRGTATPRTLHEGSSTPCQHRGQSRRQVTREQGGQVGWGPLSHGRTHSDPGPPLGPQGGPAHAHHGCVPVTARTGASVPCLCSRAGPHTRGTMRCIHGAHTREGMGMPWWEMHRRAHPEFLSWAQESGPGRPEPHPPTPIPDPEECQPSPTSPRPQLPWPLPSTPRNPHTTVLQAAAATQRPKSLPCRSASPRLREGKHGVQVTGS